MLPAPWIVTVLPETVATLPSAILYTKDPVLLEVALKVKSGSPKVLVISDILITGFNFSTVSVIVAVADS